MAARSPIVKEAVESGLISPRQAKRLKDPRKIRDVAEIVETGAVFGLDRKRVGKLVDDYLKDQSPASMEKVNREIVEAGLGLPDQASEAGLSAEEMVEFAGGVSAIGGADLLGSNELWNSVANGGVDAGLITAHKDIFDFPDEAYSDGKFDSVLEGQGEAAKLGADTDDPQYWSDFAKVNAGELSADDFVERHTGGASETDSTQDSPVNTDSPVATERAVTTPAEEPPNTQTTDVEQTQPKTEPSQPETPQPEAEPSQAEPAPVTSEPVESSPEKTVIGQESQFNIGGATWVTTYYSDGTFKTELLDNATGEVLRVGASGAVQLLDEKSTDVYGSDNSSESESTDSESSESSHNEDSDDDTASDESNDSEDNQDDNPEDDNSEDEDSSGEDSDDDSDDQDSSESEDNTDDSSQDEAETDDGEEASESTPVDPNEPSEEQKRAMREAKINDPVFQETVLGTKIYDHENGSEDTTPNPMGEESVIQDIDPKEFQEMVVGQPADQNGSTIELNDEMKDAVLQDRGPGAGLIDYGDDHFENNDQQAGTDHGMRNKTGRDSLDD